MRNHIKLLTKDQLNSLKQIYNFEIDKDNIIVKITNYNRATFHPIDKPFFINSKVRKVHFSLDAIGIWKELYGEYDLLTIQHAVNILTISYQNINKNSVVKTIDSFN